jgi:hypothetical protein
MEKKAVGLIATACSVLCCGCLGLSLFLWGGAIAILGKGTWSIKVGETTRNGNISPAGGVAILCGGMIFLLIPVLVGFFTLRKRKPLVPSSFNEPIPPAS